MSKIFGLKAFLKESAKYILNYQHRIATPIKQCHDDVWLVEFPKSGVTWFSFLVANVNLIKSGVEKEVTFFNVNDFIPDIGLTRHIANQQLPFPGHRIIKSHQHYNPFYTKVFYLVRDPRDVMVSYYHFVAQQGQFNRGISDFIRSKQYGISSWFSHVNSWLGNTSDTQMFNVLRFEDLKTDPQKVLVRFFNLLGYSIEPDILDRAVARSTFKRMSRDEDYYSKGNPGLRPRPKFCRKGKAGAFSKELSEDDINYIDKVTIQAMKTFQYQ